MKKSTNKKIFVFLLLLFVFANIAYAQSTTDTLLRINDFFENQEYKAYSTITSFMCSLFS